MSLESLARNAARREGARGVSAIGPGAHKSPDGQFLAEVARGRKSHAASTVTFRLVFCRRTSCKGHTDEHRCGDKD